MPQTTFNRQQYPLVHAFVLRTPGGPHVLCNLQGEHVLLVKLWICCGYILQEVENELSWFNILTPLYWKSKLLHMDPGHTSIWALQVDSSAFILM